MRAFHLPLDAILYGPVNMKFFDLDIENVGKPLTSLDWVKDFDEFLLLFDREHHVRANGVG